MTSLCQLSKIMDKTLFNELSVKHYQLLTGMVVYAIWLMQTRRLPM